MATAAPNSNRKPGAKGAVRTCGSQCWKTTRKNLPPQFSETPARHFRDAQPLSDGKSRHDGCAAAVLGFDSHFAAMRLDDSPDNRQPEAGAFGLRRAEHGTECAATLFFGHAFARVLELDGDVRGSRLTAPRDQTGRDRQRAAMGHCFGSVQN